MYMHKNRCFVLTSTPIKKHTLELNECSNKRSILNIVNNTKVRSISIT